MSRYVITVAGLFVCLCSHGMNNTAQINASGNEWRAFVVFVKSESSLGALLHSKCLGTYKNPEVIKENVKRIEFMPGDTEKIENTRSIDILKKDYFAIDPATDKGAFLRKFLDYSKKNGGDKNKSYALKILREMAHDALVTSQSAFSEYAGCGDSVISCIEDCYSEINRKIMEFIGTAKDDVGEEEK